MKGNILYPFPETDVQGWNVQDDLKHYFVFQYKTATQSLTRLARVVKDILTSSTFSLIIYDEGSALMSPNEYPY